MDSLRPTEPDPINDVKGNLPAKQDEDLLETDSENGNHQESVHGNPSNSSQPPPMESDGGEKRRTVKAALCGMLDRLHSMACQLTGNTHDAEDLVSITATKVVARIDSFEEMSKPETWIWSIFRHAALDFLKKRKKIPQTTDAELQALKSRSEPVETVMIREETHQLINETLAKLTERERTLISLRMEGLTHEKLGQLLHLSQLASAKAFQRALERFRETYPNSQNGAE